MEEKEEEEEEEEEGGGEVEEDIGLNLVIQPRIDCEPTWQSSFLNP